MSQDYLLRFIHKLYKIIFFSCMTFVTSQMDVRARGDFSKLSHNVIHKLISYFLVYAKSAKANFNARIQISSLSVAIELGSWSKASRQ